ncbi:MAG: hypothetical protein K9N55_00780 [Phycisphaerae bacterium]|nr:hypothetical protein [Phycisphaerae bacterium]
MKWLFSTKAVSLWIGGICIILCLGRNIRADVVYEMPMPIIENNVNTTSNDGSPSLSANGLELYFASSYPHGGDACYNDIWVATRATVKDAWNPPSRLELNHSGPKTSPCISADGLELYFADGWPALFVSGCAPAPGGYGNGDLWVCARPTTNDPWGDPVNLGPTVNKNAYDDSPSISSDGLSLYFHSYGAGRSGSRGFFDLYVTTRPTKDDPWGQPQNMGSLFNTGGLETFPTIAPDNLSLYFTQSAIGGNPEIYVSHRSSVSDPWQTPVPFEPTTSLEQGDYHLSFTPGCPTLYFNRGNKWSGGMDPADLQATATTFDLWQIEVTPLVDFNGDDAVDVLDVYVLLENWGSTDNSLCDIAPLPFTDGVVDAEDLAMLADYMIEYKSMMDANDL